MVFSPTTKTFHLGCFFDKDSAFCKRCSLLLLLSLTNVLSLVFITILYFIVSFWWTGWESNPRPEHLSINFIRSYYYYNINYLFCQAGLPFVAGFAGAISSPELITQYVLSPGKYSTRVQDFVS